MRFCFSKYGVTAIALLAILAGCSTGYDTFTECYSTSQFRKFSLPSFSSYLMNVKTGDESRIDIYLQMPYRHLRFEKTSDGYKASFSITVIVRNEEKEIIQTKELERSVVVKTYEETTSPRFDGMMQTLLLKPSEYVIEIISHDHLAQLRYKQITRFRAKDFSDSTVTASTLLLLDTAITDSKGIALRPIFPISLVSLNNDYGIFQEFYNVRVSDTIRISEQYRKSKRQESNDNSFVYAGPPYRVKSETCFKDPDSVYYKSDSMFVITKNGTQQVIQFFPLPDRGYNTINRKITVTRDATTDTLQFLENYFLPERTSQGFIPFQQIVLAMRYILREAEYDSISIATGEKRNQYINQFWESHGGMDRRKEFEQRIAEANIMFTECSNGSETPMGIVYIICGIPDYIDCRNEITETWYYNFGERSFPVQFRREKESIAYYTLSPFSINDSFWQYYIDRWRQKK